MAGWTLKQKALSKRISDAFKQYADTLGDRVHVGAITDTPEQNTTLILRCGEEFVRILDGKTEDRLPIPHGKTDDRESELPQLRADLLGLLERGCPPLDIIDFMFACTRGRNSGISDTLEAIGLKGGQSLSLLGRLCHLTADKIALLNMPHVPGPLSFLPTLLPELSDEDHARLAEDFKHLPDVLVLFGKLLTIYPPEAAREPAFEDLMEHADLALFYILLSYFDAGYPTLSVLLRTMRLVRYTAAPKARYVRRFGRVRVNSVRRDGPVRDPLGETALQRRLHRFLSRDWNLHVFLRSLVFQYLSPLPKKPKAETLREALPALMKPTR
jgi:hypothetical protein